MAGSGSSGYSPQQISSAYGISNVSFSGVAGDGAGQTIAIVDAYNDPNIAADLAAFDKQYGLSAPPSFTVDNLGATATDPGWSVETALDVEWAHAVAPKANIVLVEAPDASLSSLLGAVSTAAHLPNVSVISMSWGTSEYFGEWNNIGVFNTPGGHTSETFVAASGDTGAWYGPSFPAVSPNVLGVGGSTLTLGSGNTHGSETAWAYSTGGFSGMDNGYWYGLAAPSYQTSTLNAVGLDYGLRTSPDVSLNADPGTGYAVYDSVPYNGAAGWFDVGGTSAAAPAWAGLVAITDQGLASAGKGTLSTTQLLTNLYSLPSSDFNQITSGSNEYSAGPVYNLVTGLGTPKANLLVPAVLAANGVKATPSPSPTAATAAAATRTTHASSAQYAAIVSTASTSPTSVAASTAVITAGITSLPSPTAGTTVATASAAQVSQSAPSGSSSGVGRATGIGFGQGTSSSTAGPRLEVGGPTEGTGSAIDAIDVPAASDPEAPSAPASRSPEDEAPAPAPTTPVGVEPVPIPASLVGNPSISMRAEGDAAVSGATAAPLEAKTNAEEDTDRASMAGLVVAGVVVVLGQTAVIGGDARRRPLTAALGANGRCAGRPAEKGSTRGRQGEDPE
jgi:subtilase family serine protease